jgi:PleD family two-component response regulator
MAVPTATRFLDHIRSPNHEFCCGGRSFVRFVLSEHLAREYSAFRLLMCSSEPYPRPQFMPDDLSKTRETILVVDDNPAVLQTVVAILEGANFNVLSAATGLRPCCPRK